MTKPSDPAVSELRAAQKEARELRKQLESLAKAVMTYLAHLDVLMKEPSTEERGRKIARLCNALDMENDRARYFSLGVDYRNDPKKEKLRKLHAELSRDKPEFKVGDRVDFGNFGIGEIADRRIEGEWADVYLESHVFSGWVDEQWLRSMVQPNVEGWL